MCQGMFSHAAAALHLCVRLQPVYKTLLGRHTAARRAPLPGAVHVEACNAPAAALYLSSGFDVEAEESEAYARALNRNRRLLLHVRLK